MSDHKIGPTLPPNWKQNDDSVDNKSDEEEDRVYGPTLPPNLKPQTQEPSSSTSGVIGPTLPKHFKPTKRIVDESDSDSDDMIGPIPQTHHKFDKINEKFKYNEQLLAEREARKEIRQEREEWMTQMGKPLASKIPTKSVKHFSQRPVKSNDKNLDKNYKRNDRRDEQLTQIMDSFNKVIIVLLKN